ncbi:cation acetate symporter [Nonomuraea sp. NPDC049421]|uniref:solute symporter family protein n=1 Tax=Nonomuraea sp. NPDC049421 TaxID=3155275 RepID=UPI00341D74B2
MIFSLIILFVVSRLGRVRDTCADFYAGDRTLTAPQNGLALFGTFMMMTSFLALSDEVAIKGYDGVLLVAGFAVSWVVALLLVAEPLRNTGRYTLGDTLGVRLRERPVRLAAATVTLVVLFLYMTTQLVGAGHLLASLLHLDGPVGHALIIITIGAVTAVTVHTGGMRGTTWTQIINAVLLLAAVVVLAGALLLHYRFDVGTLLGDAASPGRPREQGTASAGGPHRLEFVSQLLTSVLGHAVLPYLFIRFLAVPSAGHTRRSVSWAIWLTTPYSLLIVLIGFGATALVGPDVLRPVLGPGGTAVPLLVSELGGVPLLAFVASVVFTTIVAVTSGLVLSAAAGFVRDVHATLTKRGPLPERREIALARRTVVMLCALLTCCAIALIEQNVAFMLSVAVTLVASTVLPALLFSWFWRGFNTAGALWSMYGGGAATIVLVVFSPAVSGDPLALFPHADFAFIPWRHVGVVSIPLAFALGYVGAALSAERDDARYARMEVRALTGAGAEAATPKAEPSGPAPSGIGRPPGTRRRWRSSSRRRGRPG